ncbi:TPA: class I mannose-6-phosphate isomerase [Aeromonas hydrophila]|uniref:class I mannose-6-phosphate isomerase n=1 Tax=Aeromonas TaxID=642 RepID=UPI00090A1C64|nr:MULTISPECIES: class I mannose-6-phosphate isomerase [Aeromonas]HEB4992129.1 class I mannose-6-phosphate isomerase [Aeromonas hydrophila subsp. hydrophila]APJ15335.1 mannose-6-phosphate isomerase [Aeromonas hydrophila]MCK0185930.1 class I mannose-6-phosphate isomerase [Aeromonas hydrophila]MCR3950071.1 class I mannose-6-phosphate isomerase [Aeromonas hydrophila]MCW4615787.1 class I mannose-6-phosphate isomerase [Aeromonas hydrophila]
MIHSSYVSNYDKFPEVVVAGHEGAACAGWDAIAHELVAKVNGQNRAKVVLVIDCYHGVDQDELRSQLLTRFGPHTLIEVEQARLPESKVLAMLERFITEDRVFGVLAPHKMVEFFDPAALASLQRQVAEITRGLVVVMGSGASLVARGDVRVYADLARWEIQQRLRRKELGNWGAGNEEEDILRRYKRAFFIEWRVFDRHKLAQLPIIDFLLDTNTRGKPTLVTGQALLAGLHQAARQPFRVVPFFDPGVWGGQWMKQVCDLDPAQPNYAWCFDCVPEENSLYLRIGEVRVEIPSQNLVLCEPCALLGERVHARFGAEFPIRFDFLDTVGGQPLSLQVHPLTEYIQQEFGMHYTQDESYYLLDAKPDSCVYLGTRTGIDPQAMLADLAAAQRGEKPFDDERFINRFPARKHDHFLIPAGTVHCSGEGAMVLEISATPYIFTFKLWDWGRVGLDGIPRPIHLVHGSKVIQWERDTDWTREHLVNRIELIAEGPGWREERTGLHEREFIETRRHWFSVPVEHDTGGTVQVLNLIEGREATVESPDHAFAPFVVHYAETFIVPASVGRYRIRPSGESEGATIATIKAYVRG